MKLTDWLPVPLTACALFLLNLIFPVGFCEALIALSAVALIQQVFIHRQLSRNFQRQEKDYQSQLAGSKKDIHRMEYQLETIFNNIPSPLALLDLYGQLSLMNASFNRFLSGESAQTALDYCDERIDPEIRVFLKESYLLEKAIVRNIHYNGIDFQCLSVPLHENGRYAGCLLVFQDISQAVEKERLQKRFIADASHELRTPIAAIGGMIEILNRPDFNDADVLKDFHLEIEKETHRLERIVQDLLTLSRMSAGRLVLKRERMDLKLMIDSTVNEIVQSNPMPPAISVKCKVTDLVYLDEDKIHQVLANLLNNACMHSGASLIEIEAEMADQQLQLIVRDNGCGINTQDLEHIFERFYRVDTHRARLSGGSGLGLAIVKSIVNAHGGEIQVLSEEGSGTEFRICLPIAKTEIAG